ncbi:MAG TPA: hypothetical protein VJS39_11185 [Gemmatimonadaceae bacterium]|nr:hypothetical protein [Gemmatimonadaceae bacterium]
MRRSTIGLVFVGMSLLAGCKGPGDSEPIPPTMPGTYVYAGKGSVFRKPWEFSARLDLSRDRHFTMTLDKTIDGHRDPTETTTGAYALNGDQVVLRVVHAHTGPEKDMHKLKVQGDSLIGEVGWTGTLFLKGIGAPNVVFVKQRS